MTVYKWSQTASSNATADSSINWAEGQAPSSVNDSARAMMAAVAKFRDDISGSLTTGGTSTAYTLTTNQVFSSLTTLNGAMIAFVPHTTNGASATLAVDGLAAKAIRKANGTAAAAGDLVGSLAYVVTYNNSDSCFYLQGGIPAPFPSGTLMLFQQTSAPTGWTKGSSHNDKALRVVTGSASSGGTTAFTTLFAAGVTSNSHVLTQAELPNVSLVVSSITGTVPALNSTSGMSHTTASGASDVPFNQTYGGTQSVTFGGSVPLGGSGTGHTHTIDLAVQYVDVIIASKD